MIRIEINGPAGSGKTHLTVALVEILRANGFTVRHGFDEKCNIMLVSHAPQNFTGFPNHPIPDVFLRNLGPITTQPTNLNTNDYERIWLEPRTSDDRYGPEGRNWCQDKVWPDGPDDGEPTEYIRRDLFDAVTKDRIESEIERLKVQNHLAQVTKLLKAIVNDAKGMRPHGDTDNCFFGPFSEWDITGFKDSDLKIEWPNLAISVGEAEAYLKELEKE